jgi:hypothetical protein
MNSDAMFSVFTLGVLAVVLLASAVDAVLARWERIVEYYRAIASLVIAYSGAVRLSLPLPLPVAKHVKTDAGDAGEAGEGQVSWQERWSQEAVETFSSTVTKGEILHQLKLGVREAEIFKLYWDERGSKACGMPKYVAALDTIASVRAEFLNHCCEPD